MSGRKKVLALVNPKSGCGNAQQIFDNQVAKALRDADIEFELIVTEVQNHALRLVKQLTLTDWAGLILVGGDGIVHEVLNGFLARRDYLQALKLPFAHIPGGSGNALAAAVAFQYCKTYSINHLAGNVAMLAGATTAKLNLLHAHTPNGHLAAFLSADFGMSADVEVETGWLRWLLGSARFDFGIVMCTMRHRSYRAKVSYLAYPEGQHALDAILAQASDRNDNEKEDVRSMKKFDSSQDGPAEGQRDNANQQQIGDAEEDEEGLGERLRRHWTVAATALDEPVPASWACEEDEWVLAMAVSLSHISSALCVLPVAHLDDDCFYLCLIRNADSTRYRLMDAFTHIQSSGVHLTRPFVRVLPVRGVRIEPLVAKCNMCVDGEPFEGGPTQLVMTDLKATLMVKHI